MKRGVGALGVGYIEYIKISITLNIKKSLSMNA